MFNRILVPLDGSGIAKEIIQYVRILAGEMNSKISLLHVVEPVPPDISATLNPVLYRHRTLEYKTERAYDYLERISRELQHAGGGVSMAVREGDPAVSIMLEAESEPGTLIAISSHGRSGFSRWWLGSVAHHVLHHTNVPLFMVNAHDPEAPPPGKVWLDNMLIPLDGSHLAEQVLPYATDVAKALNLGITLVRVTPGAGLYYYSEQDADAEGEAGQDLDQRALAYMDAIRDRLRKQGVDAPSEHLLHGAPAVALLEDCVHTTGGTLVAMATHGRSGLSRWIMGSVADQLIRRGGHPVLVVRAADDDPSIK